MRQKEDSLQDWNVGRERFVQIIPRSTCFELTDLPLEQLLCGKARKYSCLVARLRSSYAYELPCQQASRLLTRLELSSLVTYGIESKTTHRDLCEQRLILIFGCNVSHNGGYRLPSFRMRCLATENSDSPCQGNTARGSVHALSPRAGSGFNPNVATVSPDGPFLA